MKFSKNPAFAGLRNDRITKDSALKIRLDWVRQFGPCSPEVARINEEHQPAALMGAYLMAGIRFGFDLVTADPSAYMDHHDEADKNTAYHIRRHVGTNDVEPFDTMYNELDAIALAEAFASYGVSHKGPQLRAGIVPTSLYLAWVEHGGVRGEGDSRCSDGEGFCEAITTAAWDWYHKASAAKKATPTAEAGK